MTREEARDELAHRWAAPSLTQAAIEEGAHVRNWLARQLLGALTGRRNDGGKAV